MPKVRRPLLGLRASGKLGGHRRGPYSSQSLTSWVVADAKIAGVPPLFQTFTFGSAPQYRTGLLYAGIDKTTWERSLLRFDLSSLIGRSFSSAELVHETTSLTGFATELRISRCVDPADWVESQVSWLQRSTANPWGLAGGDFDDTGPPASVDFDCPPVPSVHGHGFMLPFVTDALANRAGILSYFLRPVDENPEEDFLRTWWSKESGATAPHLILRP